MKLANKTAVITGGATGIGLGIATAFAAEGCRVAIGGRRAEVVQQAVASWTGKPAMVGHAVDVANRESATAFIAWARETLGRIDILVNAAGINIKKRTMADIDPAEWDQVMQVNATGAFNCIHSVLPEMRARKDGLIINVSSIAGKRAAELGGVAYNASKFAMTALGTSVGLEERKNNIRVTNVYPGEVDTPILLQRPVPVSEEHRARILQPDDLGGVIAAIAALPPRAHVPEIVIMPTSAPWA